MDYFVFRTNTCRKDLYFGGQGYLTLRIYTRGDAIYIVIFGREGRHHYGKGGRLEQGVRVVCFFEFANRRLVSITTNGALVGGSTIFVRKLVYLDGNMVVLGVNDRVGGL